MVDVCPVWQLVWLRCEDRIWNAFQACPESRAEVVDRAYKVGAPDEVVGDNECKNHGANPSSDKSFDGLLGAEFDQLGAPEGDTAQVCKDIVTDDKSGGLFKM